MVSLCCLVCALGLATALTTLYVDNQSVNPSPVGSADAPFADLTQALLSTADLQVAIQLPSVISTQSYAFQTLGMHTEVSLSCSGNGLKALFPVVVGPGVVAKFQNCHFSTDLTSGALMVVLGGLTISGGSVQNSRPKGFALYGSLRISDAVIKGNRDSIFAVQSFGFELIVERCVLQGNTSPVGVVLLLGISGTNPDSSTVIRVENCTIVGNGAYMGGSFVYVNISPEIKFSPGQLSQARNILVQGNVFNSNPGYLCILYPKFLNITFNSNLYQSHNYGFLVKLSGGSVTISNSTLSVIGRCLISTRIVGSIRLQGVNITNVTEGPAILVQNSADQSLGSLDIERVRIRFFTHINPNLFTGTILAMNAYITVTDLYTSEGNGFSCGLGCFAFSTVMIRGASTDKVVFEQAVSVGILTSNVVVYDLTITNSTATRVGFTGLFISTAIFRNLNYDPGIRSFLIESNTNMMIMVDSSAKVYDAYFNTPPVHSEVVFYNWNSHVEVYNLTIPRLYGNILSASSSGSFYINNLTIFMGKFDYLAHVSFNVNVTFEDVLMNNTNIRALFSALTGSVITARRLNIANLTLEGLILSTASTFELSSLTLRNIYANTLFWYCSASHIQVTNFQVTHSTFDLTQFLAGTLVLRQVVFTNVTVRNRFITANKATILFDGFELNGLEAKTVMPFAKLGLGSSLTFRNAHMSNFRSREQNLISSSDSTFTLERSSLSDFNVTFFSGIHSAVYITDSVIYEGGLKLMDQGTKAKVTAGLLDCEDSQIFVIRSQFRRLSGTNGGVISLKNLSKGSSLSIETSVFQECSAAKDGGVIHAIASNVSISSTVFEKNTADRGACLYFECADPLRCSSEVTWSSFTENSAREGAALKWTLVRPHCTNNTSVCNKAVYGEFEASIPTHMALANFNTSAISGVAGVIVVVPILIVFLDSIEQGVMTDASSVAIITTPQLIGTTYLIANNGISNFSSVIVQTVPGNSIQIDVFSPTISNVFPNSPGSNFTFPYHTRLCVPGEVTSSTGCYLCPKNTFSVDPLERECRACPGYATCPGGSELLLDPGYWRISQLTSDVYECPIRSACAGGQNSTCERGYTDRLCARCAEGYYVAGLTYCLQCEALPIRALRISLFIGFLLIIYIFIVKYSTSPYPSTALESRLATVRILLDFLQSLLMISCINVDWRSAKMGFFSANEMFVSLGASSFTLECYEDWGVSPVVVRAIVASIMPLVLMLLIWPFYLALYVLRRHKKALYHGLQSSLLLLYSIHPYIVRTAVGLIACKTIDSSAFLLISDVSLKCWQSEHLVYVFALFLPMFLLFIIGIPGVILLSLTRFRKNGKMVFFFLAGYRLPTGLWGAAICLRKTLLILVLGLLGSSESVLQILSALVVLYVFLEWHIRTGPFVSELHNRLEAFSILLQLKLVGFSFYFMSSLNINDTVLTIISYISLCIVLCFILACLCVLLIQALYGRKLVAAQPVVSTSTVIAPSMLVAPPPSDNSSIVLSFPEP